MGGQASCQSVGMSWLRTVARWPWTWLVLAIALAPAWLILLNDWAQANAKKLSTGTPEPGCIPGAHGGINCSHVPGGSSGLDMLWAIVLMAVSLVAAAAAISLFGRKRPKRFYA